MAAATESLVFARSEAEPKRLGYIAQPSGLGPLPEQIVQLDGVLTEFAAVIAGADGEDAVDLRRGLNGCPHCGSDRGLVDSVDHNFVSAVRAINQFRFHLVAQCWAIGFGR